ncbi:MAG: hypothetical protein GX044_03175 [Firmicutes bacterium]|jgi:hypothetical protein|nr:hypothetical protein [Bacillota bacterium]
MNKSQKIRLLVTLLLEELAEDASCVTIDEADKMVYDEAVLVRLSDGKKYHYTLNQS